MCVCGEGERGGGLETRLDGVIEVMDGQQRWVDDKVRLKNEQMCIVKVGDIKPLPSMG